MGYNKVLHTLGQKTVLETVLDVFLLSRCNSFTVVTAENDLAAVRELTAPYGNVAVVVGGATRSESVRNGLSAIQQHREHRGTEECAISQNKKEHTPPSPCVLPIVVIHDGARPFVTHTLINRTIQSAQLCGSGIAAVPAVDTIKEADGEKIARTLPRSRLFHTQTPQAFRFEEILDAYKRVKEDCLDDSQTYQEAGYSPRIVPGDYGNIKLTTEQDFLQRRVVVGSDPLTTPRIGAGFDVHRLVEGRKLILGGVQIPFEKGLLGHSDADVLIHAIMDALLSAAGMPDIGVLFPDTDPKYKDADSMKLLKKVHEMICEKGFSVGNISAVVMAEKPKLAAFIPDLCRSIAAALSILPLQVNVSATTTEGLGIVGEGKGMAASATCLLGVTKS